MTTAARVATACASPAHGSLNLNIEELGLPASAGLATSEVTAKVASGLAKPRGVMLVPT